MLNPLEDQTYHRPSRTAEVTMSKAPGVSTERLNSLLGHVSHKGFDDLVDPKNQGIAYPTANPDFLVTGDPLFYTNLLATLDMFRLNSASLTFGLRE